MCTSLYASLGVYRTVCAPSVLTLLGERGRHEAQRGLLSPRFMRERYEARTMPVLPEVCRDEARTMPVLPVTVVDHEARTMPVLPRSCRRSAPRGAF